ncbi:hypothetical protein SDC9_192349 [bioreactor metagenome]|uniref:Uncharacterized protein n=1 Tax=bioreactor metagenome TaxID=1076179 RepID=A0A645I8Z3_9ZZZZ
MQNQVVGQDRRRDAPVADFARLGNARRGDGQLDRIEHDVVVLDVLEAVPRILFAHHPRFLMGGKIVDIRFGESDFLAVLLDPVGLPHAEEPVIPRGEFR